MMTAGLRSLDWAFYGDPGIGKTWSMSVAAEMVDENLVVSKGSGSDQSIVYQEKNEDNKFVCRDESEFFEDTGGGKHRQKSTVSARMIAREKTRLETAIVEHETTVKQIDPDTGMERHVTREIAKVLRGGSATNANGPPINQAFRSRLAEIDCENPGISGSFNALPAGPMHRQFYTITRLFHSLSQVSCCLLEHFVKNAVVEIDTTAVDVFLAILRTVDAAELGLDVPTQRKQKDLEKCAECFAIKEVTTTLWGTLRERLGGTELAPPSFTLTQAEISDLVVRASLNLVVSSQAVISAFWLLFPLSNMKVRTQIEAFVFGGNCLFLKPIAEPAAADAHSSGGPARSSSGGKPYTFPWMLGAAVRVGNNQYLASNYESIDTMARTIYNEIKGTNVKCPSEVSILKMLTSMQHAPPMRPASLAMMDVSMSGRKGNLLTSQRVCILGAALNRSTTDVEAALLSGFLEMINATPIDELVIGYDDTAQGPNGWVLFDLNEQCSVQTDFTVRRKAVMEGVSGAWTGDGSFTFTRNGLCVLDPHHILRQTGAKEVSREIANGVQRGVVNPVSSKVRELQKLLTRQQPDIAVLTAPVADTGELPWSPGGECESAKTKILSQLTIQRQQIASSAKNPPWESGCPPFRIIEGCDQAFKLKSGNVGAQSSSPFHPNVKLYPHETGTKWYVKFYVQRSVELVDSIRKRSDLPPALISAIQDFDNVFTGTAEWRRRTKPSVLAGATVQITSSGQAVPRNTFVPFKETSGRRVRDVRFNDSEANSMCMEIGDEERKDLAGRDSGVFPGTARFVALKFGQNIHAKQVRARFDQFLGAGWEGIPEIEQLMSSWVREISDEG